MYESANTLTSAAARATTGAVFPLPDAHFITRAALERSARQLGSGYAFEGASPAPEEAVLAGRFNSLSLRPGLILHAAEVQDLHDLRTQHTLHDPGIKIGLVIEGETEVAFGPRQFRLGPERHGGNRGVLLNLNEPTVFARQWQRGRTERKVTLTLTREWLEQGLLHNGAGEIERFARHHLSCHRWSVTPRAVELARQILGPDAYLPGLHRLRLESRCLELATEALSTLTPATPAGDWLSEHDRRLLSRLEALLHEDSAVQHSLADIARLVGSNPTSLQALARRAWHTSIFERLRAIRMEKARALLLRGVSVGEAAAVAGYGSATNFATAFRRRYGISPSRARTAL